MEYYKATASNWQQRFMLDTASAAAAVRARDAAMTLLRRAHPYIEQAVHEVHDGDYGIEAIALDIELAALLGGLHE